MKHDPVDPVAAIIGNRLILVEPKCFVQKKSTDNDGRYWEVKFFDITDPDNPKITGQVIYDRFYMVRSTALYLTRANRFLKLHPYMDSMLFPGDRYNRDGPMKIRRPGFRTQSRISLSSGYHDVYLARYDTQKKFLIQEGPLDELPLRIENGYLVGSEIDWVCAISDFGFDWDLREWNLSKIRYDFHRISNQSYRPKFVPLDQHKIDFSHLV